MEKYNILQNLFISYKKDDDKIYMENYMKNNFTFYWIKSPIRKVILKDFLKEQKDEYLKTKVIDWAFLKECYDSNYRENQYFVLDYLEMIQKYLKVSDLENLEYFVNHKPWWDSIDRLDKIIGSLEFPSDYINELMLKWSLDKSIWKRRLAIDHQLNRKEKTNGELLKKIILNNLNSQEFFINKAIGWSLRNYSRISEETRLDTIHFIYHHQNEMSKLSIKESRCL